MLQNCFYMQMVSSSLALHLHFGDLSRNYLDLHQLLKEAKKYPDGTINFESVYNAYE